MPTPAPADGLAGIAAALTATPNRDTVVTLEPGETYRGDTPLVLDAHPDASPRNVAVVAEGARIQYEGDGPAITMCKTNCINEGQNLWLGGHIEGPGPTRAVGFRATDCSRNVIRPRHIYGFETLIEAYNEDSFTEYLEVGGFRCGQYTTGIRFRTPQSTHSGKGSSRGTTSFRGTLIEDIHARPPQGKHLVDTDRDTSLYASTIQNIHTYAGRPEHEILRLRGWLPGTLVENLRVESGGSKKPGTAVVVEDVTVAPRLARITTTGGVRRLDNRSSHRPRGLDVHGDITYTEPGTGPRVTDGKHEYVLTVRDGKVVAKRL